MNAITFNGMEATSTIKLESWEVKPNIFVELWHSHMPDGSFIYSVGEDHKGYGNGFFALTAHKGSAYAYDQWYRSVERWLV